MSKLRLRLLRCQSATHAMIFKKCWLTQKNYSYALIFLNNFSRILVKNVPCLIFPFIFSDSLRYVPCARMRTVFFISIRLVNFLFSSSWYDLLIFEFSNSQIFDFLDFFRIRILSRCSFIFFEFRIFFRLLFMVFTRA